jgi:hypothetical protein
MISNATNVTKFQVDQILYWEVRDNVVIFLAIIIVRSTSTQNMESSSTSTTSTMTSTIIIDSSTMVIIMIGIFVVIDCIYIYISCIYMELRCSMAMHFIDMEPLGIFQVVWEILYTMVSQGFAYVTICFLFQSLCIHCSRYLMINTSSIFLMTIFVACGTPHLTSS